MSSNAYTAFIRSLGEEGPKEKESKLRIVDLDYVLHYRFDHEGEDRVIQSTQIVRLS